jgi:hypothetical protein
LLLYFGIVKIVHMLAVYFLGLKTAINKCRIGMEVEGSGRGSLHGTISAFI